jgi:hypothetical protein
LTDRAQRSVPARFVFAVGSEEVRAERGHVGLEVGAGEAFVGP